MFYYLLIRSSRQITLSKTCHSITYKTCTCAPGESGEIQNVLFAAMDIVTQSRISKGVNFVQTNIKSILSGHHATKARHKLCAVTTRVDRM